MAHALPNKHIGSPSADATIHSNALIVQIFQNFQQNIQNYSAHIIQLEQKIIERDATIKFLTETTVQKSKKNVEAAFGEKISTEACDMTKWNDVIRCWKELSNPWQNMLNISEKLSNEWQEYTIYYKKIAAEKAEELEKCLNEKSGQQQAIKELKSNLEKKTSTETGDMTKCNDDVNFWKDMSNRWEGYTSYYQKTSKENAEKFKQCSNEKSGLQQTIEDLNGNLHQKKVELKTCKFWESFYRENYYR